MYRQIDRWLCRSGSKDYAAWQAEQPELSNVSFERFSRHVSGDLSRGFETNLNLDNAVLRALIMIARNHDVAALIVICSILSGRLAAPRLAGDVPGHCYQAIHHLGYQHRSGVRYGLRRHVEHSITRSGSRFAALSLRPHDVDPVAPTLDVDSRYSVGQLLSEATANQDPQTLLLAMSVFYDGDTLANAARSLGMNYQIAQKRLERLRAKLAEHAATHQLLSPATAPIPAAFRAPQIDVAQKRQQCTLAASVPEAANAFSGGAQ